MRLLSIAVVALAGLLAASSALTAQRISGRVLEAGSSAPVPGAVVSLVDSAGRTVARTVSQGDGRYSLPADEHAAAVGAMRIGYRPARTALRSAAADTNMLIDFSLDRVPAILETVAVHDQTLCPAVASGPAAFALWEQARSALDAEVVSRDVNPATVRTVSYVQRMDGRGTHVQEQVTGDSTFVASRALVSARTAREFADRGYRDIAPDSVLMTYYAPDAQVLLDSTFLHDHCLSVRESLDHPDDIGIAFDPARNVGSRVDVAGVLWLNRARPALHTLEFRYTNLTPAEIRAKAGGELSFTEMPNGITMISHWRLHTPIRNIRTTRVGRETVVVPVDGIEAIVGYNDIGGDLANAKWGDGSEWSGNLPVVRGHVVDAGTDVPLAGAMVRFRGTRMITESDSLGAFALPSTVPGRYVVEATDGLLASLGLSSTGSAAEIAVDRAPVNDVRVVLPARDRAVETWCAKAVRPKPESASDTQLLVGRVQFANGTPAPDAMVVAEWTRHSDANDVDIGFRAQSNPQGTFAMCGMPSGSTITLIATRGRSVSETITVRIAPPQRAAGVTLVLPNADPTPP